MSPFEMLMLLCFGASWPFAVYKTYASKSSKGKSILFLWLVWIGYISGIMHKIFWSWDVVILLYFFNGILVSADLFLAYKYRRAEAIVACTAPVQKS